MRVDLFLPAPPFRRGRPPCCIVRTRTAAGRSRSQATAWVAGSQVIRIQAQPCWTVYVMQAAAAAVAAASELQRAARSSETWGEKQGIRERVCGQHGRCDGCRPPRPG